MSRTRRARRLGLSAKPAKCRCEEKKFDAHGRRRIVFCKLHRCYVKHGEKDRVLKLGQKADGPVDRLAGVERRVGDAANKT